MPEILLIPDGHTKCRDGREFDFDQESWSAVEKAFKSGGIDLVIDYEHQTAGGQFASPDGKAPAAGWIKGLRYEPGRGLLGTVDWTAEATTLIQKKQYRYLSPYMMVNKETKKVSELMHAAITNNPAISGMEEISAKVRTDGFVCMAAKAVEIWRLKMDKPEPVALSAERLAALSSAMKQHGFADGSENADQLFDKLVSVLANFKKPELTVGAVAAKLGLAADAGEKAVLEALDAVRKDTVPASEYVALKAKVETMELAAKTREQQELIACAIESAKLNPNNEKQMNWARAYVKSVPAEAFKEWMETAPALHGVGRIVKDDNAPPKNERAKVIAGAKEEFAANRAAMPGIQISAFVNSALTMAGETLLTADEKKSLQGA